MNQTAMVSDCHQYTVLYHVLNCLSLPIIVCEEGDVRTSHLSESEFIVEVCRNSTYRAVCLDTWDQREATVVCRQLDINDGKLFL